MLMFIRAECIQENLLNFTSNYNMNEYAKLRQIKIMAWHGMANVINA